jgi:hypothetical protein
MSSAIREQSSNAHPLTPDSTRCPECDGLSNHPFYVMEKGKRDLCVDPFHAQVAERLIHIPNKEPLTHEQAAAEHARANVFGGGD